MKTDTLFYYFFKTIPTLFFEITRFNYSAKDYRFDSVELKQVAFRIDGVFKPRENKPELPIIFTEVQFQADEQFYARFFSEIFLYLKLNKPENNWKAVVIFKNRTIDTGKTQHYQPLLDSDYVKRIYLEDFKNLNDNFYFKLIQIIIGRRDKAIGIAKEIIHETQNDNQELILELVETAMVHKFPNLSHEEIRKMIEIDLSTVDITQTHSYKEGFLAGEEIGELKGEKKGEKRGEIKGEINFFHRLLESRFGTLPNEIELRLQKADKKSLKNWGDAFLSAKTLTDIFAKDES